MEFEDQDQEEHEEAKMPSPSGGIDHAQPQRKPRYRECLKNHAVGLGGHATDGCCEFLPAGPDGSLDALKCAACNCHRNFHRKDPGAASAIVNFSPPPHHHHQFFPPHHHHHHQQFSPFYRTPTGYLQVAPTQQRPLALPSTSGGGGSYSREEQEDMSNPSFGGSKKRFRTKFSQEQKDKMLCFAESVGWRIQKQDEEAVNKFCNDTGVKRHVLKVWMHNNKHTLGKKP